MTALTFHVSNKLVEAHFAFYFFRRVAVYLNLPCLALRLESSNISRVSSNGEDVESIELEESDLLVALGSKRAGPSGSPCSACWYLASHSRGSLGGSWYSPLAGLGDDRFRRAARPQASAGAWGGYALAGVLSLPTDHTRYRFAT